MPNEKQVVGNAGLFYISYQLSKLGWNVSITSRNAKGVDIIIYSSSGRQKHTIQIKSLSKNDPAPFGTKLNTLEMADYIVVCSNISKEPEVFIAKTGEVRNKIHGGEKNGKKSYWLQPKEYKKFSKDLKIIGYAEG